MNEIPTIVLQMALFISILRNKVIDSIGKRMVGGLHLFAFSVFLSFLFFINTAQAQEWLYTVRPGDTLWNIAAEHLQRMDYWPKLQTLNQVADPERLPPGMKLRIPILWLKRLPTTAQVASVQGQVQVIVAATNQTTPLQVGQALESGDIIRTGPDGSAALQFGDGSRLLVQPNTVLDMKSVNTQGETSAIHAFLSLWQGRVESQVVPRATSHSQYEISTPVATTAVRGTHYRVGMETKTSTARTEVLQGGVTLQGQSGGREVGKGFGAVAEAGKPIPPPSPLLPPPDTATLPPVITRVPIRLTLPALKGARAYRLQIAPNHRFEQLLFDAVVPSPEVRGPDLPDGEYVLRLRGIDAKGLEGRDAYHNVRLHARPEPPFLIQPAHQGAVLQKSLQFEWSQPEHAADYHLQLARDEHFSTLLADTPTIAKSQWTPDQSLEPGGPYYWRVAVRDVIGKQGPFSDPQSFKVQPALEFQPPEVAADTMTIRWSAGFPDQKYEVQLARDKEFSDLVASKRVAEPQLTIPRPESGIHYLRIRSIEADGLVGPYGASQRMDIPPAHYWPFGLVVLLALVLAL